MTEPALDQRLEQIVRASPRLMRVLERLRELDFPDWRIGSGAVFETVWNALTGRDPDYGIKDYDVLYFDPDISWEAEDAFIRRAAAAFEPPLREMVEVRNQARVHLWFEAKFGEPYSPVACTDEAVARFQTPVNAMAVRLEPDGRLDVLAPFGLEDCFAMRLRPNPVRPPNALRLRLACEKLTQRWPEVTVVQEAGA
jgi:hypothetical protein